MSIPSGGKYILDDLGGDTYISNGGTNNNVEFHSNNNLLLTVNPTNGLFTNGLPISGTNITATGNLTVNTDDFVVNTSNTPYNQVGVNTNVPDANLTISGTTGFTSYPLNGDVLNVSNGSDRVTLAGGASTTATLSAGDTVILDAGGGAELFSFTVASITNSTNFYLDSDWQEVTASLSSFSYNPQPHQLKVYKDSTVVFEVNNTDTLYGGALSGTGNITTTGNLNISGNTFYEGALSGTGDITTTGNVYVENTAGVYTDKIRRYSDSDNTTKILLNDEVLKLHAGHSTDEVVNISSDIVVVDGSLNITGNTFYEGALSGTGNISTTENLYVSGDTYLTASGTEFAPRPNLYFFANCDAVTIGPASDGSLPSTNTTDVSFSVTHNNNTTVFDWTAEELTITRAGLYKFTYNVTLEGGMDGTTSNRTGGVVGILQDTGSGYAVVQGTESYTYNRITNIEKNTGSVSVIYNVTANEKFKIVFARTGAQTSSSKLGTVTAGTAWTVEAVT